MTVNVDTNNAKLIEQWRSNTDTDKDAEIANALADALEAAEQQRMHDLEHIGQLQARLDLAGATAKDCSDSLRIVKAENQQLREARDCLWAIKNAIEAHAINGTTLGTDQLQSMFASASAALAPLEGEQ